jgi:pimeloyl-ACP methyl ester carboxylesterase
MVQSRDRRDQGWVLNTLLGVGGMDILHPGAQPFFEELGYDHEDFERVFQRVRRGEMLVKAWFTRASEVERLGRDAEAQGFRATARDLYLRASLLYGRGQYSIFRDDPRKLAYYQRVIACYDRITALSRERIQRVRIPFEGKAVHGILCLPERVEGKIPAIVFVPGMDMIKEDWLGTMLRKVASRGVAAFALDGPGHGESLLNGLKVTPDNFDRAFASVFDFVAGQPEVDGGQVGLFGVSWGSYLGIRAAAAEGRLAAVATGMGCYDGMEPLFAWCQPNFRSNYQYMSGVFDDAEFARMEDQLVLTDVLPAIKAPVLLMHGEFDELNPLEPVVDIYERITAPKEMWVFEDQFHPLGGVAAYMLGCGIDWLLARMRGEGIPGNDRRRYIRENGEVVEGDQRPLWWDPDRQLGGTSVPAPAV